MVAPTSICAGSPRAPRSPVTDDGRRLVQFLEVFDFFIGQFDIDRVCKSRNPVSATKSGANQVLRFTDHFLQVLQLGGTDDGSGDLLKTPRDGNLGHLYTFLVCDLFDAPDDVLGTGAGVVEADPCVRFGTCGGRSPRTGKNSASDGAPRNDSHSEVLRERWVSFLK